MRNILTPNLTGLYNIHMGTFRGKKEHLPYCHSQNIHANWRLIHALTQYATKALPTKQTTTIKTRLLRLHTTLALHAENTAMVKSRHLARLLKIQFGVDTYGRYIGIEEEQTHHIDVDV